jgi:hypothetical protein
VAKKPTKSDRQAVIDEIRKKEKGAEQRRFRAIAGVAGLVAVLLIAAAAYRPAMDWWDLRKLKGLDLASIGAPASVCEQVETEKAEGSGKHEPLSEQITYDLAPPAFGSHWSDPGQAPVAISRKFYTAEDRPELEALVHNLEHGYTLLWYDETAAEDSSTMTDIQAIADKFHSDPTDFGSKFIAVPWTSGDTEESGSFPSGHVAFTHWSVSGSGDDEQQGVWQYCSEASGAALETFMSDYPYRDSPEPRAP